MCFNQGVVLTLFLLYALSVVAESCIVPAAEVIAFITLASLCLVCFDVAAVVAELLALVQKRKGADTIPTGLVTSPAQSPLCLLATVCQEGGRGHSTGQPNRTAETGT